MNRAMYRHEIKFICPERDMVILEGKIRLMCRKDPHIRGDGAYSVRSVYFDTPDNACLYENESGVDNRHKYRIRIYNFSNDFIKLERKSSVNGFKHKEDCIITDKQCDQLFRSLPIENIMGNQELLKEFTAEKACPLLRPAVIVDYARTPYVYPIGNVRITFDRNITASHPDEDFFLRNIPAQSILPQSTHILEVKYDELLPGAILELLNAGGILRRTSLSKYALCRRTVMF